MIAFDIDGVFVSDVEDYRYDIPLSNAISYRLYPIFNVPENIDYCLITSRSFKELDNTLYRFCQKLKHMPRKVFHDCNWESTDEFIREKYKLSVMRDNPEIDYFFESEQSTIDYLVNNGIDANRLILWSSFIAGAINNHYLRRQQK